ncbi:VWA domain-containing protein [Accumulibacter sp.]|uniref:VWA domain-containing protein n=1 Tax=Accumulibacter sp. TaxID=2053492 RepID=UPI002CB6F4C1|nr:VWA domain-containing protein [Accumulibacter sp.]HPU80581.1 VWA domain-containing protein [Accumulibacter sp.]
MALIDLKKKTRIVLEKRALPQPPRCRVGLCIDISGSMHNEYQDGLVQETVDRLLAIAGTFDDNGEMEVWTFNQGYSTPPVARAADFGSYVRKAILDNPKVDKWGGTNYAPVMNAVLDTYFRGERVVTSGGLFGLFKKTEQQAPKDTHIPALCLFITDGDNSDAAEAERILREAQKYQIYWQLIGIGNDTDFRFIKKMADDLPNAGFCHFPNLRISDDAIYEALLTGELCDWLRKL